MFYHITLIYGFALRYREKISNIIADELNNKLYHRGDAENIELAVIGSDL